VSLLSAFSLNNRACTFKPVFALKQGMSAEVELGQALRFLALGRVRLPSCRLPIRLIASGIWDNLKKGIAAFRQVLTERYGFI
jgi:hypothetical protein